MTIKELKEQIAELPDDMIVVTEVLDSRYRETRVELASSSVCFEEYYDSCRGMWCTGDVFKIN